MKFFLGHRLGFIYQRQTMSFILCGYANFQGNALFSYNNGNDLDTLLLVFFGCYF